MKIIEAKEQDLYILTEFIIAHDKGTNKMRYIPTNKKNIQSRLLRRLKSDDKIYMVYDHSLEGVIELLIEEDDHYIQILSMFVRGNIPPVLDNFLKFLKDQYKAFDIDVVLGNQNKEYIGYFNQIHAETDGFETMLMITKEDFQDKVKEESVYLHPTHYESFRKLHDYLFPNVYWTSERLLKEDAPFKILVKTSDNLLLGYCVLSMRGNKQEELYFTYGSSQKNKEELILQALSIGFKQKEEILVLLTKEEEIDLPMYQKMGFKEKEKIITYSV